MAVHILSTLRVPIFLFSFFSKIVATLVHRLFNTTQECLQADLKFITVAETSKYEAGYFINRLHKLSLNQAKKANPYCFFSILSLSEFSFLNEFGIPQLNLRLKKIMGFSI